MYKQNYYINTYKIHILSMDTQYRYTATTISSPSFITQRQDATSWSDEACSVEVADGGESFVWNDSSLSFISDVQRVEVGVIRSSEMIPNRVEDLSVSLIQL